MAAGPGLESNGERNRGLFVLKSRGMAHSNQIREFRLTSRGIDLLDVYVGPGGVLTGTARVAQQAREASEEMVRQAEFHARKRQLDRNCLSLNAQMMLSVSTWKLPRRSCGRSLSMKVPARSPRWRTGR